MPKIISSLKRLVFTLVLLDFLIFVSVLLFDQLIATPIGLPDLLRQAGRIGLVVAIGFITIIIIRRSKTLLSKHIGVHAASVSEFFMILTTSMVMVFALLHILQVDPRNLLIGGGIVSIVLGLVISTFVGNTLAGTLLLMTRPFEVGDTVLINNVPCKVEEITSLVTKVKNDLGGQIAIPNTAIMQGGIVVTSFHNHDVAMTSRLPYVKGDRIFTTYLNSEGVVTEVTALQTKVLLDSGKELTFLNTSVLAGTVAIAKIK